VSVVARYGLAPLAYGAFTKRMFSNFSAIYGLQEGGAAYPSVAALLQAMQLHGLTQQRCSDTLQVSAWDPLIAYAMHVQGLLNVVPMSL
jgi:hypothetical protein